MKKEQNNDDKQMQQTTKQTTQISRQGCRGRKTQQTNKYNKLNTQTNLNYELKEADKIVEEREEKDDDGEQPSLARVHWLIKQCQHYDYDDDDDDD